MSSAPTSPACSPSISPGRRCAGSAAITRRRRRRSRAAITAPATRWNTNRTAQSPSSAGADDVITSSGYRIGPFDVESALIEHPAVNEAAVVGVPDPQRTEIVKAFVVLAPAFKGSEALAEELAQHVKKRLSAHSYPREVEFVSELPKTPSGKIQRFLLRKAEMEKRKAE